MKIALGMVTFGNLPFTQLALNEIRRTTRHPLDLCVIVGQPGDTATETWLRSERIPHLVHERNLGFPASINDIYDAVFRGPPEQRSDALILAGNDIVPYPNAVDALIECAETTDWEWICSSQLDARSLVQFHPEAGRYFEGATFRFTDFTARPWELHSDVRPPSIEAGALRDVRNLCLFKRSVFDALGYADVNFWPGGYFEDNDYCVRAHRAGVRACTLPHSAYFHFWSRTIHQGNGSTTSTHFNRNAAYYAQKWGGPVDAETRRDTPWFIGSRAGETQAIQYWSTL